MKRISFNFLIVLLLFSIQINAQFYSYNSGTFKAGNANDWTRDVSGATLTGPAPVFNGTETFTIRDGHTVTLESGNPTFDVLNLQVGQGATAAFYIGDNTTALTAIVRGLLDVKANANVTANSTAQHILRLYGNLTNAGTINLRPSSSNVVNTSFYGASKQINGPNTPLFNSVTFKTSSSTTANVNLDIDANITFESGCSLANTGQTIYVAGTWTENAAIGTGGQMTGTGTVEFNGSGNTIANNPVDTIVKFNNVVFNGGAPSIQENLIVTGSFTATGSTQLSASMDVRSAADFTINTGSQFTQTTGRTYYYGGVAQAITLNGSTTFYDLLLNNGSPAIKTFTGNFTTTRYMQILSNTVVAGSGTYTIGNTVTVNGTCNFSGIINQAAGELNCYNAGASTISFPNLSQYNITGVVTVRERGTASSVAISLNGNMTLSVNGARLIMNPNATLTAAGILTLQGASNVTTYIDVIGTDNFPLFSGGYALNSTYSQIRYLGTMATQKVHGASGLMYGALVLGGGAGLTKQVDGAALDVNGIVYFNTTVTLNLGGFENTFAVNITNNGAAPNLTNGSVTLDNAILTQTLGAGTYALVNLTITANSPSAAVPKYIATGSAFSLTGNLTITNTGGSYNAPLLLYVNDNNLGGSPIDVTLGTYTFLVTTNVSFGANFLDKFSGTKSLVNGTVLYYNTTQLQNIADGVTYGNLAFSHTFNKVAEGALDINGNLYVETRNLGVAFGGTPYFVDGGFTHTVAGNFSLGSANMVQANLSGTIILDGATQAITASNFNNLTVSCSGVSSQNGAFTIYGNLTVSNSATLNATTFSTSIYGNWSNSATGVFTQTTGTVSFLSTTADQTIASNNSSYFGNVTITKANASSNNKVTVTTPLEIRGNLTLTLDKAVIDISNQTIKIGGRLYHNANANVLSSTIVSTGSTVIFNGSSSQYIYQYNDYPISFNNLKFQNSSGTKYIDWDGTAPTSNFMDVNGDFEIESGVTVNVNNWLGGNGVNITIAGNWTNAGTFNHTKTVYFDGGNQTIGASTFNIVSIEGTNTKTLGGSIVVNSTLTIQSGSTLDVNAGNYSVTVKGNWDNTNGTFVPRNGTVTFAGAGVNTIITGGTGAGKKFYSIEINHTAGSRTLAGDIDVDNNFIVTQGLFTTSTYDMWIAGNFDNGGTFSHSNNLSVITFNGTGAHTFNPGVAGTTVFMGIVVNAPGATYTVQNNFLISQINFILTDGIWDLNGKRMTVNTNLLQIQVNGGSFEIDEGASLVFTGTDQQLLVQGASAVLEILGVDGNIATVTKTAGYYSITQSNGTLQAKYYKIDQGGNVAPARVSLTIDGGTIDATNKLDNGTYSSGTGTSYIALTGLSFTDFTVSDVVFNAGPTYNVARTSGSGTITFANSSGALAGELNDNDNASPGTLINFTFPNGYFWDAGAGTDDWNDDNNWSGNMKPDANAYVYLDHSVVVGAYTIKIKNANADCHRLTMDAAGGAAIGLTLESGYDLALNENFQMSNSCTLTQTDATNTITVGGNWSNSGTGVYNNGSSTVTFNGGAGTYSITPGGIGAGKKFYNVTINADASSRYQLTGPMDIDNNLTITTGILDLVAATNDITVGGNMLVDGSQSGSLLPSTADVTFDGAAQNISGGTYYNFIIAGTNTKTIQSNIDVNGSTTLGNSTTVNAGENTIYTAINWINNGCTFSQTGIGTIVLDGTTAQSVDFGSQLTAFNNLTLAGAGVKTFYKSSSVATDFTISNGCGTVNLDVYAINGDGSGAFTIAGATTLQVRGSNNFPANFSSYSLVATSTVQYISDIDPQIITVSPSWSYGNITLTDIGAPGSTKRCQAGDLTITGTCSIGTNVNLDMNTNSANMILTGNLALTPPSATIDWGTGTTKLTHVGGTWNINTNITSFNNIEFNGTGNKYLNSNITVTGDMTIKNGVSFFMTPNTVYSLFYTVNCTGTSKVLTMENGGALYNCTPSATAVAFPTGFTSYTMGLNSNTYLQNPAAGNVNQTIATRSTAGNQIIYGNITINNIARAVSTDGLTTLDINGNFSTGTLATFSDGNVDMNVAGSLVYFNELTSFSSGKILTIDGLINQTVLNSFNNNAVNFKNITFSGNSTTKTFGDATDILNIAGTFSNSSGCTVTRSGTLNYNGTTWNDNGTFQHTAGTITFDNTSGGITITNGAASYFFNTVFNGANTTTFATRSGDVNGTFTINAGTVNMGSLSHTIAGTITNTAGGTWTTANANITFDGTNQNINTTNPAVFTVTNLTLSGVGTKRQFSNWNVTGNVLINTGSILNNSDAVIPTYYNITCGGNWTSTGAFTHNNQGLVTFNSAGSDVAINNGASTFWNVDFGDNIAPTKLYTLTTATTTIFRAVNINTDANVKLNGKTLVLGNTAGGAGKIYTVAGTLDVDANSFLKFDNTTNMCTMNVSGTLKVVGTDASNIATITQQTTRGQQINITTGTIEARYYLIGYLSNAGFSVQSGATLHATNNFSDGTWSNIANVNPARYLSLETDNYAGGTISNVTFNCTFAPVQGQHFTVQREVASSSLTFDNILGNLGAYRYEDDETCPIGTSSGTGPLAATGKLHWPAVTQTNWTGAISEDWNNAGNWDNGIPTSTIDAIIADQTNDPRITSADATCKKLTISNGTLTLENGYDLTTSNDITIATAALIGRLIIGSTTSVITCGGSWTRGANGIFSHGSSTVIFKASAGSASITPLSSDFNNVQFDQASTTYLLNFPATLTINVLGNFEILNALTVVNMNTNVYTLKVGGNFTNAGTFNPVQGAITNGTVEFNKAGDQTITKGTFYVLKTSGSGIKLAQTSLLVNDSTYVSGTSTLKADAGCAMDFNGNMFIINGATFHDGDQNHTFAGQNWTSNGTYSGAGTMSFDRTTGQTNTRGTSVAFNNLIVKCTGQNLYMYSNVSVTGSVTLKSGIVALYLQTFSLNSSNGSGAVTMESAVSLYVSGTNNFPSNFSSYSLASNTTVFYNAASDQTIYGVNTTNGTGYGNLTINSAFVKTLAGNIAIQGNLTFNNATLDVSNNNYSLELAGSWTNNATPAGTFIPRSGEVILNGSIAQNINVSASAVNPFTNLTVNKSANTAFAPANYATTISGNLVVSNGIFSANGQTINIAGNMTATFGTFANSGTYYLNKASGTASVSFNNSTLNNVTINSASGAVYTLQDGLTLLGNFILTAGTFNGNGKIVNLGDAGTDNVTIAGTYKVGPGGRLALGNGTSLSVNTGATIEVVGTSGNNAMVTHNSSGGFYSFTIDGTIKARYYQFEYMASAGIYVTSGGTISAYPENFSDGTFTNGSGTVMLRIENTQSFTNAGGTAITNVSFPVNSGGYNVRKISAVSGTLDFYNASGVFAGEIFDDDPSNLINWSGIIALTWNGSQSTNWNTANNWTASSGPNIVPTGAENVIIATATNQPILTTTGQITANLTINTGATLTLNTGADAGANDLDINGDITINGTLRLLSVNDFISVAGNWTKGAGGTVNNSGNVTFDGTSGTKNINNGASYFYNVTIGSTITYQLGASTYITNNLSIFSGATLDVTSTPNNLFVGGNWSNAGTFTCWTGKVTFNATSGTKTISAGTSSFNNIDINASGATYQINTNNLSVKSNLNLIAGALNCNNLMLNIGDGVGTDYLTIGNTAVFDIGANGSLKMGASAICNVNSGGTFKAVGTDASNIATVTRQSAGTYTFTVLSGATIEVRYFDFEYMDVAGINLQSGSTLHATNNFSDGTFVNGANGGTYLTLSNNFGGNIIVNNTIFNAPVAGTIFNVTRTSGTGNITLRDASGLYGTSAYEYDDEYPVISATSGLVRFDFNNTCTWLGGTGDWNTGANWSTGVVPTSTKYVVINSGNPQITSAHAECRKVTLNAGTLSLANNYNLTVAEEVWFAGTISATGSTSIITAVDWTCSGGTFTAGSSKVKLNGTTGTKTIANTGNFYDLEIAGGANVIYRLGQITTINNDLILTSGTLQANTYNLSVGRNWTNTSATFTSGSGTTVTLAGTGSCTLTPRTSSFYNLTLSGAGTFACANDITITNNYTQSSATVQLSPDAGTTSKNLTITQTLTLTSGILVAYNASTVTVSLDWNNTGGTFTPNTSTVILNGAGTSRVLKPRTSSFYNLTISGSGTYIITSNALNVNAALTLTTASLDVSSSNYAVNIGGNFSNSGTFIPRSGTVTFNNNSTIQGTTETSFYNVIISGTLTGKSIANFNVTHDWTNNGTYSHNEGTVTFPGTTTLGGTSTTTFKHVIIGPLCQFTVPDGFTLTCAGAIRLKSDASGTASLLITNTGGISVSGQSFVERFYPATNWHYFSSTVANAVTNVFHGFFLWDYDETLNQWVNMTINQSFIPGKGYDAKLSNITPNNTVAYTGGSINNGTITYPVSFTSANGWNVVGNPYPCAIDWGNGSTPPGWNNTNIDATIYYYDGTQYLTYNRTTGGSGSRYIPAGQGVFIHCTAAGQWSMDNRVRLHNSQAFYKKGDEEMLLNNSLKLTSEGNGLLNSTYVVFYNQATTDFDSDFDGYKLFGSIDVPSIYTKSKGADEYEINTLPMSEKSTTVPLIVKVGKPGKYSIVPSNIGSFDNPQIYIQDNVTTKISQLVEGTSYDYTADSAGIRNFTLYFGDVPSSINTSAPSNDIQIYMFNHSLTLKTSETTSLKGEFVLFDNTGRMLINEHLQGVSEKSYALNELPAGIYMYRFITDNHIYTKKIYVD